MQNKMKLLPSTSSSPDTALVSLPKNLEAESAIIGCLLIDPNSVLKAKYLLNVSDFYSLTNQSIYTCCLDLHKDNKDISIITLSEEIKRKSINIKQEELVQYINKVESISLLDSYISIIKQKSYQRQIVLQANKMIDKVSKSNGNPEEAIDTFSKHVSKYNTVTVTSGYKFGNGIMGILDDCMKRVELFKYGPPHPYGLVDLDKLTGGLHKGELVVIGSRTSLGKTSLALQISYNVALVGTKVAYLSAEMNEDSLRDRLVSNVMEIDGFRLSTGRINQEEIGYIKNMQQHKMPELTIVYKPGMSELDISKHIEATTPDFVFVDYIQLIKTPKSDTRARELTDLCDHLKAMAGKYNCGIVIVSQLSRDIEKDEVNNRIPRLSDLKDCLNENTKILMSNGTTKLIKDIKINDSIISVDDYTIVKDTVKDVIYKGSGNANRLYFNNNNEYIDGSNKHPFKTINGWKFCKDLKVGDSILKLKNNTDLQFVRISKIDKINNIKLYDIKTEKYRNFIANNLVVHNSGGIEQCLSENTIVPTKRGLIKIKDIIVGDTVMTIDDNIKCKESKVTKLINNGVKQTYKVKTRYDNIDCTSNTLFYTIDGWKMLSELNINDYIAIPKKIELWNDKNDVNISETNLLAYLIADGCFSKFKDSPKFYNSNNVLLNDFILNAKALNLRYHINNKNIKSKDKTTVINLQGEFYPTHGKRNKFAVLLENLELTGKTARYKFIPDYIFTLDKNKTSNFLSRLFSCDGCVSLEKPKIFYSTASDKLAYQVQYLLLKYGIFSSVHKIEYVKFNSNHTIYNVNITGKSNIKKYINEIGFIHPEKSLKCKLILDKYLVNRKKKYHDPDACANTNIDFIPNNIIDYIKKTKIYNKYKKIINNNRNRSRKFILKLSKEINDTYLDNIATSEVLWVPILSIEKNKIEQVYDLSIDGTHNFFTNNFIVHNSADLVLLLQKGEEIEFGSYLTNIYISKQRNGPIGRIKAIFEAKYFKFKNYEQTGV